MKRSHTVTLLWVSREFSSHTVSLLWPVREVNRLAHHAVVAVWSLWTNYNLTVRHSGESTVSMALAHFFTGLAGPGIFKESYVTLYWPIIAWQSLQRYNKLKFIIEILIFEYMNNYNYLHPEYDTSLESSKLLQWWNSFLLELFSRYSLRHSSSHFWNSTDLDFSLYHINSSKVLEDLV